MNKNDNDFIKSRLKVARWMHSIIQICWLSGGVMLLDYAVALPQVPIRAQLATTLIGLGIILSGIITTWALYYLVDEKEGE